MQTQFIPFWKTSPFCRLIIPVLAGIMIQWYIQLSCSVIILFATCFFLAFTLFYFLPVELKFRLQSLQGILMMKILLCFAMFITWQKDTRHTNSWYGHYCNDSSFLLVRVNEPLAEKSKSYKAEGYVESVINNEKDIPTGGKLFMYFSKDTMSSSLHYGDRILIKGNLQQIKNSGNPGAFNYERYGAFQQVFYTVYLKEKDFILLRKKNKNPLHALVFFLQSGTIHVLQKYISGDNNVLGIAEALLIGYKEDLDKDLVQAYSNAGVVHIIAISGLHLGLIYIMLVWIFDRLPWIKKQKLLKVILILVCLWLFSLLTGASASVLRSAVMFTCIMIGKNFFKQTSIYNSLAASAFILLCYDPYFLWDVGFQLSYLAVIGIVWLQKPLGNLVYFKKAWLNKTWNMLTVTFAAQIMTFPICIYYFHQFPNLFFITNLIAVPLSTIILFAEIFLVAFAWIPLVGIFIGKIAGWLIWMMNFVIRACNDVPFSLMDNIYANIITTVFLYLFVISICAWLIGKNKSYFRFASACLLIFTSFQSYSKIKIGQQKKILIYNVPKHQGIDFIYQDRFYFLGDSAMLTDGMLRNFHLKPARIALQTSICATKLAGLYQQGMQWTFFSKIMIVIDSSVILTAGESKFNCDVLLISKNPGIKISDLATVLKPAIVVFDASNSLWKIAGWKKECERLALPCFSIPEEGAFMLDIE
ncbi:MAG: ComEC/Rec2 family competence protein [Ferruginibacter sp.]